VEEENILHVLIYNNNIKQLIKMNILKQTLPWSCIFIALTQDQTAMSTRAVVSDYASIRIHRERTCSFHAYCFNCTCL